MAADTAGTDAPGERLGHRAGAVDMPWMWPTPHHRSSTHHHTTRLRRNVLHVGDLRGIEGKLLVEGTGLIKHMPIYTKEGQMLCGSAIGTKSGCS